MEEISINELLQRVIEGKAPKEVMIDDKKYKHNLINEIHDYTRVGIDDKIYSLFDEYNMCGILDLLNTKIKISDKPIIEELSKDDMLYGYIMGNKINEIIKWINNKE